MECEEDKYGNLYTKLNGVYHSFDGKPAIKEYNNSYWYKEGRLHRDHLPGREDNLPAVINTTGAEWWNGMCVKKCVHKSRVKSARNI